MGTKERLIFQVVMFAVGAGLSTLCPNGGSMDCDARGGTRVNSSEPGPGEFSNQRGAVSGLNIIAARLSPGRRLREQFKPLACERSFQGGEAGDVPTRAVE